MSPIPLGILAAQGGFSYNPVHAYTLISTTVASSNVANLTVSNLGALAATYKHLELRVTSRSTSAASALDRIAVTINGLGDYSRQWFSVTDGGTGEFLTNIFGVTAGRVPANSVATEYWGSSIFRFPDAFHPNKVKTIQFQTNTNTPDGSAHHYGVGMALNNTAPITSISIRMAEGGNSTRQGSRLSLYGIRG